jgi:ferritin-like protein
MRSRMDRHLGALARLSRGIQGARFQAGAVVGAEVASPDEPPPEFSWHDYMIFLLSMAAEIEHSLMVQYFYAAWSLGGPQVPEERRQDVLDWQRIILGIAKEEMGHLITVQNVLKLLGGPLHLDREDFPWISAFYPYRFHLEPASLGSLAKYVVAESPEIWPANVAVEEREKIIALAHMDAEQAVARVGTLYHSIIGILLDPCKIPGALFRAETYPYQASWDEWGRGYAAGARGRTPTTTPDVIILRASSRSEAIAALSKIAEQGEAVSFIAADAEESHFSRFLFVYREFSKVTTWNPALALPKDPRVAGIGAEDGGSVIQNPEADQWAGLFNLRYRMLLSYLAHAFRLSDDPAQTAAPGHRGQIVNRIFGEMYNLRAIAGILAQLPLNGDLRERAGPPFQMPYIMNFPAAEPDFWRVHEDLLEAAARQLANLRPIPGPAGASYAEALARADHEAVVEIRTLLNSDRTTSRYVRSGGNVR